MVDALWEAFRGQGYSWVGFYIKPPATAVDEQLLLGPRRDKPACSPIGLHGACGQAYLSEKTLIVRDVMDLGADYIACDPNDKSEIVIPLIDAEGQCWGVLDIDSFEVGVRAVGRYRRTNARRHTRRYEARVMVIPACERINSPFFR